MKKWFKRFRRFRREEEGQGLVEYAFILALISFVVVGSLSRLGRDVIPNPFNSSEENPVTTEEVDRAEMTVEIKLWAEPVYNTERPIKSVKSFAVDVAGETQYIYQFPVDFEDHLRQEEFDWSDVYGEGVYAGMLSYKVDDGELYQQNEWYYDGKDIFGANSNDHFLSSYKPSSNIRRVHEQNDWFDNHNHKFDLIDSLQGRFKANNSWVIISPKPLSKIEIRMFSLYG